MQQVINNKYFWNKMYLNFIAYGPFSYGKCLLSLTDIIIFRLVLKASLVKPTLRRVLQYVGLFPICSEALFATEKCAPHFNLYII